jgi:hypothetical protein
MVLYGPEPDNADSVLHPVEEKIHVWTHVTMLPEFSSRNLPQNYVVICSSINNLPFISNRKKSSIFLVWIKRKCLASRLYLKHLPFETDVIAHTKRINNAIIGGSPWPTDPFTTIMYSANARFIGTVQSWYLKLDTYLEVGEESVTVICGYVPLVSLLGPDRTEVAWGSIWEVHPPRGWIVLKKF